MEHFFILFAIFFLLSIFFTVFFYENFSFFLPKICWFKKHFSTTQCAAKCMLNSYVPNSYVQNLFFSTHHTKLVFLSYSFVFKILFFTFKFHFIFNFFENFFFPYFDSLFSLLFDGFGWNAWNSKKYSFAQQKQAKTISWNCA